MKRLNEQDILQLLSQRETHVMECKAGKAGIPRSLWESYSAFANMEGGIILIGVSEERDQFEITGVQKPDKVIEDIWNTVNNSQKVSINILFERCVYTVSCQGGDVIVMDVPRAMREERPVFIGNNPYTGTWRRNGEGDYRCTREVVNAMIRDNSSETLDHRLVAKMSIEELNADSIRRYRNVFQLQRPQNPWNEAGTAEFLLRIGAAGRDGDNHIHPTLAGLLFFGNYNDILKECPHYFVDFREHIATDERYSDRVSPLDLTWSGNVFDFYMRIIDRLTADVKTPFALNDQLLRVDDTPVHKAIRECLANALIHADYMGNCGVVVEKYFRRITFANPGCLRVPKHVAIEGGNSSPRNECLFNLFVYINVGEKLGSGLAQLYAIWKQHHWPLPSLMENWELNRTLLSIEYPDSTEVPMDSNKKKTGENYINTNKKIDTITNKKDSGEINIKTNKKKETKTNKKSSTVSNVKTNKKSKSNKQKVFTYLHRAPSMTLKELAKLTGLSVEGVRCILRRLIAESQIVRVGPDHGGYWMVQDPPGAYNELE